MSPSGGGVPTEVSWLHVSVDKELQWGCASVGASCVGAREPQGGAWVPQGGSWAALGALCWPLPGMRVWRGRGSEDVAGGCAGGSAWGPCVTLRC